MAKSYLIGYNAVCAVAWAVCFQRVVTGLISGSSPADFYANVSSALMFAQGLMVLDIVHALTGLVRSPFITVLMQVGSRLFLLFGHTMHVQAAQSHWSLYLMVGSWSFTEVCRYSFYASALMGNVPYPIFWLRYSTFMALYPTGITGEMLQVFSSLSYWAEAAPIWYRMSIIIVILYVPGSPGMIGNMLRNRRNAFKKRSGGLSVRKAVGVCWPLGKNGERASTETSKDILAAAQAAGPGGEKAALLVLKEKNWRFGYGKHMLQHVQQSLQSTEAALRMARAGLDKAHDKFTFVRGSEEVSVKEAMRKYASSHPYDTAEMRGTKQMPEKVCYLNYGAQVGKPYAQYAKQRNNKLQGPQLLEQLEKWVAHGCLEADTAEAVRLVQQNQDDWLDLSNDYFVLLGASSAMGPLYFLLSLGANVICVDLNIQPIWKKLFAAVKDSPGRIIFPVVKGTDVGAMLDAGDTDELAKLSGSNLMTDTPEIAAWISGVCPGQKLVLGSYVYLMGALFPQITVCCDAIIQHVCSKRPDVALAQLCTPTDAHVTTKEAVAANGKNYSAAPGWQKLFEVMGLLKRNTPISAAQGQSLVNGILTDQGPNYILAKRMQHWRAMLARAAGHTVSTNVAPSTATISVLQNKTFAAGYANMHLFAGMEIVFQELSLSAMGVLLIHDLKNPQSAANSDTQLPHPLCLMQRTAWHGGVQRCPYTIGSIGIPSAIFFYLREFAPLIVVALWALVSTVSYICCGALPSIVSLLLENVPEAVSGLFASLSSVLQLAN